MYSDVFGKVKYMVFGMQKKREKERKKKKKHSIEELEEWIGLLIILFL